MSDFTKLSAYLDSFVETDPSYALAAVIKAKIAEDFNDRETINNGEDEELTNNDVTMATPEQQTTDNLEGQIMDGAFQELDALNQIKEKKEEIVIPGKPGSDNLGQNQDIATPMDFGNNTSNQKQASAFIKDVFFKDLSDNTKEDVSRFVEARPDTKFIHYGSVIKELLPKVDKHNFDVAEKHIKADDKPLSKDKLIERSADKFILVLNDKVIDGHHFLARCKAADITNSLHVLDLTPARFQKTKQASLFQVLQKRLKR